MENDKYAQLNIVRRKLLDLKPHPKNPRAHPNAQMEHLERSVEKFSFAKGSIVYQKGTDYLLAGHAICETLIKKGFAEADVIEWETDDITATQFLIADNKTSDDSEWDIEQLEVLIKELDSLPDVDLRDTGFDLQELDELFPNAIEQKEETFDIDEAMEDEAEPVTKTGDIWLCGKHRVMCGDSTKAEDVERLMNGEKADMVFTDPPYGIDLDTDSTKMLGNDSQLNKTTTSKKYDKIIGDDKPFNPTFIFETFPNVPDIILWGADYYAKYLPDGGSWYVWDKRENEQGSNVDKRYGSQFELCWSKSKRRREIARIMWAGAFGTQHEFDRKRCHPTQKPTRLAEWFFERIEGDLIVDLFLGSGTTLIAAEKTGRICYGMEISPKYCDVICRRYHEYTGDVPTLESTGEPFPVE